MQRDTDLRPILTYFLYPLALAALSSFSTIAFAINLGFLDQAPVRHFTSSDTELMTRTVDDVLDNAADGEMRDWRNEETGSSGEVTAIRSFDQQDMSCRRIRISNEARGTTGSADYDVCKVDGTWRVLRVL